jgi:hypothetical protein
VGGRIRPGIGENRRVTPAILDYCHWPGCKRPVYELRSPLVCDRHLQAAAQQRAARERVGTIEQCDCGDLYVVRRIDQHTCGRGACRMRAHRRRKAALGLRLAPSERPPKLGSRRSARLQHRRRVRLGGRL